MNHHRQKGTSNVRRHAKASSAGSTQGQGHRPGSFHREAAATRASSLCADGSGAPSHRAGHLTLTVAVAVLALLALAPSALAVTRSYQSSFGTGDFTGPNPQTLAVDQSNGDIYAVDTANGSVHRFDSDGNPKNFTAGPDSGSNTLTGFSFDGGPSAAQVAIDNSGGPADGDIYVAESAGSPISIKTFSSTGAPLGTLDGSTTASGSYIEACGLAVDQSNGDLYIGDYGSSIWRYSPSAGAITDADYSGGVSLNFSPCQVAADDGHVYAADWNGGGPVYKFKASSFATGSPPSVTGTQIDATATALATDPGTGDLYVDEGDKISVFHASGAHFYDFGSSADFGSSSAGVAVKAGGKAYVSDPDSHEIVAYGPLAYGNVLTVSTPGPGSGTVTSSPDGINCIPACQATFESGTVVTLTAAADPGSRFNSWSGCDSVAANECTVTLGSDKTVTALFTTSPAVSATNADQIGTDSARLSAKVNPQGESTTYHFEYGTDTNYGSSTPESSPIGSDAADHAVTKSISGLAPGTTYHYRVVATNQVDTTNGPDQTFTTFGQPPAFDPCPNDDKRTGAGAYLPDCRAYEQASPVDKNGSDAQGYPNDNQASTSGDAVTFVTHAAIPGGQGAQEFPFYMARRGETDWSTEGLMPPATHGYRAVAPSWTSDLKYSFTGAASLTAPEGLGPDFLMQDTAADTFTEVHPHTSGGPFASSTLIDASQDGSKVYFERRVDPLLAPNAAPGKDNLYVWDRDSGAISLAGVLPDSACGTPPCVPAGGSFAGPWDYISNRPASGGIFFSYHVQYPNVISDDGSRAFFTSGGDDQLYVRKDAGTPSASTDKVSASHRTDCADHDPCNGDPEPDPLGTAPATFQRATPSGSKVFFTSPEKLTDDATTGPPADTPQIGRADAGSGANPDRGFVPGQRAKGLARDGNFLYWIDPDGTRIGRADVDDADCSPDPAPCHVNENFVTGTENAKQIAFHSGQIYWTNGGDDSAQFNQTAGGSIGRADLPAAPDDPAANVDQNAIDTTVTLNGVIFTGSHVTTGTYSGPSGIAFDNSGHIFWGDVHLDSVASEINPPQTALVRADADGSNPQLWGKVHNGGGNDANDIYNQTLGAVALAVQGNDLYDLVQDQSGRIIYRVSTTDEFGVHGFFGVSGEALTGIAADSSHFYWSNSQTQTIGVGNLDGTGASSLVTDVAHASGVAADGSHVFFSALPSASSNPGNDLYAYETSSGGLTDLTPDDNPADVCPTPPNQACGAQVQGVLGSSDDGSYVYFAANGDLDGAGPATLGDCRRTNPTDGRVYAGKCSLYLWHDDNVEFITKLDASQGGIDQSDSQNWNPEIGETGNTVRPTAARVSADGKTIIFRSNLQQTAYDNTERTALGTITASSGNPNDTGAGACDAATGFQPCSEFYRFNTESGMSCLSCNPTGQRPGSSPTMRSQVDEGVGIDNTNWVNSRNMSADGTRFFFETMDKLVAADTNGDAGCPTVEVSHRRKCQDVYEWEASGAGSCTTASSAYSSVNSGCIYLISSGKSPEITYLLDSSASGDDAFFFTRDKLVPQDGDGLVDIYDAKVGGGFESQQAQAPPSCSPEDCQGPSSLPPVDTAPGSSGLNGPGNQGKSRGSTPTQHAKKRCKKKRKGRKCRKSRRASANKGGAK